MDHVTILFLLSCPLSLYETIWAHMGHMILFLVFWSCTYFLYQCVLSNGSIMAHTRHVTSVSYGPKWVFPVWARCRIIIGYFYTYGPM